MALDALAVHYLAHEHAQGAGRQQPYGQQTCRQGEWHTGAAACYRHMQKARPTLTAENSVLALITLEHEQSDAQSAQNFSFPDHRHVKGETKQIIPRFCMFCVSKLFLLASSHIGSAGVDVIWAWMLLLCLCQRLLLVRVVFTLDKDVARSCWRPHPARSQKKKCT